MAVGAPTYAQAAGGAVYEAPAGSADAGTGTCTETGTAVFACSDLRAAISSADGNPGSTVKLEPGVYQLGVAHGFPSGQLAFLDIDASVTIQGAGPGETTIEQTDRRDPVVVVPYNGSTTPWQIAIEGVKLTGGVAAGHEDGEVFGSEQGGGALRANGDKVYGSSVTLFNDSLVGNRAQAPTASGGAIFNKGILNVIDSTVAENTALGQDGDAYGGGIFNSGVVEVADSTIADNTAHSEGESYEVKGGGVDSSSSIALTNTTVTGNVASTSSPGNNTAVYGGGVALWDDYGSFSHVTLYGNVASPTDAWFSWGGNLYEFDGAATTFITNTIIADGTASAHGNCVWDTFGPYREDERNDLEDDAGSECHFSVDYNSIVGVSPRLMPLAANGGPTETMAPLPGSPVIGGGTECAGTYTIVDQRGMSRNGHCDIGAFQTEAPFATAGPKIIGTAEVGQMLTCEPGSWTGEGTLRYAYEWLRDGVSADDRTSSYAVGARDAGSKLACLVTATGTYGLTEAMSPAVEIATPTTTTTTATTTNPTTTASTARTTSTIARTTSAHGNAQVDHSARVKSGEALIKLSCSDEAACTGTLKLVARVSRTHAAKGHGKRHLRKVVIGTTSFSIAKGASETLHVRLSTEGRRLLRTGGKKGLRVRLVGSGIEARSLVLRAPKSGRRPRTANADTAGASRSGQ